MENQRRSILAMILLLLSTSISLWMSLPESQRTALKMKFSAQIAQSLHQIAKRTSHLGMSYELTTDLQTAEFWYHKTEQLMHVQNIARSYYLKQVA